jgi:hypothetical protein
MPANLVSPRLMYLKAGLFLVVGVLASAGILVDQPSLRIAGLLGLAIWGFARAYYFAFYVIEHYVDSSRRYSGLGAFLVEYCRRHRR